jgi:hypothetical protein
MSDQTQAIARVKAALPDALVDAFSASEDGITEVDCVATSSSGFREEIAIYVHGEKSISRDVMDDFIQELDESQYPNCIFLTKTMNDADSTNTLYTFFGKGAVFDVDVRSVPNDASHNWVSISATFCPEGQEPGDAEKALLDQIALNAIQHQLDVAVRGFAEELSGNLKNRFFAEVVPNVIANAEEAA